MLAKEFSNKENQKQRLFQLIGIVFFLIIIFGSQAIAQTDAESKPDSQVDIKKKYNELKEEIIKFGNTPKATLNFNLLLNDSITDEYARKIIINEILSYKIAKNTLLSILETLNTIAKVNENLLIADYIRPLLILRASKEFEEAVDKVLLVYQKKMLSNGIIEIFKQKLEQAYENYYIIKMAIKIASDNAFFTPLEQLNFIEPLINILTEEPSNSQEFKDETQKLYNEKIYKTLFDSVVSALLEITHRKIEDGMSDAQSWSNWWASMQKLSDIEKLSAIMLNLRNNYKANTKELTNLQEENLLKVIQANATSLGFNVESLKNESELILRTAIRNIDAIITQRVIITPEENTLVLDAIKSSWFRDISQEIKKLLVDLSIKVQNGESAIRVFFNLEVSVDIRKYIIEKLAQNGIEISTLDKLILIIRNRDNYSRDVVKSAITGLGRWKNYDDPSNHQIIINILKELIQQCDDSNIEAITLANTINELAHKVDISEIIVELFDKNALNTQQLLVLLRSALRNGNSPKIKSWFIKYERENKFLANILADKAVFIDLQRTIFEIIELLAEPFIEPIVYNELYDALTNLYLNPPKDSNGAFVRRLEDALVSMCLPMRKTEQYDTLTPERKAKVQTAARQVPLLLLKREMSDFILKILGTNYPKLLISENEDYFEILRTRASLRAKNWLELSVFNSYKKLADKNKLTNEILTEDIRWSLATTKNVDSKIAPRLIETILSVNTQLLETGCTIIIEFANELLKVQTRPSADIYLMQLNKRFDEIDKLSTLLKTSENLKIKELNKIFADARKYYLAWFEETKIAWNNISADLTSNEAKTFALSSENYRVVLSILVSQLEQIQAPDDKAKQIWGFIDSIASAKGIILTRWAEGLNNDDFIARVKTLKREVSNLSNF